MRTYRLSLTACLWRLENGTVMAECPSFPEVSCAADSVRSVVPRLERGIRKVAQRFSRTDLMLRQSVGPVTSDFMSLDFEPTVRTPAWQTPVATRFSVVIWPHGADNWVLWVPVLGIHVLGRSEQEVREQAPSHIRAAVARNNAIWEHGLEGVSLPHLAEVQRAVRIRLLPLQIDVPVRTPKVAVQVADAEQSPRKSVVNDASDSLTVDPIVPSIGNESIVAQMASILTGRRPRSVLLVGPSGVGKTAALRELVRRRHEFGLSQTDFRATSGARLVAGMSSFGMWQERCQSLCRETEKSGAILHLGSLTELVEVGRCEGNSMGIATFLRPYLVRGALLAVAESTPEQLALIERLHPQVVQAFEIIRVTEPDPQSSRQILAYFAQQFPQPMLRDQDGMLCEVTLIDESGLTAIERLHRRYATYSAFPGRPLRFLRNLLRDRFDTLQLSGSLSPASAQTNQRQAVLQNGNSATLSEADIVAAFSRETGLPLFLLDDRLPFDPAQARQALGRRVVGQHTAVDVVLNLLSTVKSGLSRPGRPLASLLFIGPTGVGKTELARTLAEYLFGDEGRLTRLDMSEYGDPISAQRLIGGTFGDEGVLTAKIREQPFSVILLDEFEKADGMVFDLMLQVLGEGRLTDGSGRLADFTNSVIVMTSNLGAEAYQQGAAGFARSRGDVTDHFLEAVRQYFRPELFNRFDAVVPFQPLGPDVLKSIAEIQVRQLRKRDGLMFRDRGWELDPIVLDGLVERGFDPRYGARPLKRVIERELLAPLAEQLNSTSPDRSVTIQVSQTERRVSVRVAPYTDQFGRQVDWTQPDAGLVPSISRVTSMRRLARRILDGFPVQALRNELFRLDNQLERERRRMLKRPALGRPWKPEPDYTARVSRAGELRTLLDEVQGIGGSVDAMEDQVLLGLLVDNLLQQVDLGELARLEAECRRVAGDVYLQQFPTANKLTLAVFSEHQNAMKELVDAYREVAATAGAERFELWEYSTTQPGAESIRVPYEDNAQSDPLWFRQIRNHKTYLNQIPNSVVGLAWFVTGHGLFPHFRSEGGLHVFVRGNIESVCLVVAEAVNGHAYRPPLGIGRQGTIVRRTKKERRREYDMGQSLAIDPVLDQRTYWRGSSLDRILAELIRAQYDKEVFATVVGPERDASTNE